MTRERWEQILFAHVADETVQDMLNEYVLELESENSNLRELATEMFAEHRRLYYSQGILRGQSATSKQMAHWHDMGLKLGIEVWGE